MADLEFPRRMLAAGEEPWGDRVNVYQKMDLITKILGVLEEERAFLERLLSGNCWKSQQNQHGLKLWFVFVDGQRFRVDLLDFPESLREMVKGEGEPDRIEMYNEADYIYMPFNFDKKHWVVLVVDLRGSKIQVLDCNMHLRKDSSVIKDIQPIAVMLPYLFTQVDANIQMSQVSLDPFKIKRVHGIPQITSSPSSSKLTLLVELKIAKSLKLRYLTYIPRSLLSR